MSNRDITFGTLGRWALLGLGTTVIGYMLIIGMGCGGGGSEADGGGGSSSTSEITGIVSGTLVVAVNDQGDILASDNTAGRAPDVDRNGDGINESFTFNLNGISTGINVRIYLIDGGIYPMYFDGDNNGSPESNVFELTASMTIALGLVDISDTGNAIPENNPANISGITTNGNNSTIPVSIVNPDTSGLSLGELINAGLDALKSGGALMARTYFAAAEAAADGQTTNLANTARFFYAVTRAGAFAFDTYSDGDSSDLNQVGDLLDAVGCPTNDNVRSNVESIAMNLPEELEDLPNNSPTATDVQDFLYNVPIFEFESAIGNLNDVSQDFNYTTQLPDGTPIEFDYGDILVVRAAFKALLAALQIQEAYDLADVDIDALAKASPPLTWEEFLDTYPDLLDLLAPSLTNVQTNLDSALEDLGAAIDFIESETDTDQSDDFINFIDIPQADIDNAKNEIAQRRSDLYSNTVTIDDKGTPEVVDDVIMNPTPFFTGLNLRNLMPNFTGNDPGYFPDETLSGVIVQGVDLNEDINANGIPDILE